MGGWVIIWSFLYGSSPLSNLEWKYLGYGLEKKEEKEKFPPLLSLAFMQCAMRNGFRERGYQGRAALHTVPIYVDVVEKGLKTVLLNQQSQR